MRSPTLLQVIHSSPADCSLLSLPSPPPPPPPPPSLPPPLPSPPPPPLLPPMSGLYSSVGFGKDKKGTEKKSTEEKSCFPPLFLNETHLCMTISYFPVIV
ncbi:hypothetical protein ATANTOWER_012275 [Ataeniobius toweri]|uniref:Uncharacterized protein n=1 Tax=Ataeniobius toweri TaxID=208326 RepID=A0ABU7B8U7_9TELE|nr:hypothetical protein [Ataeniobius toweri]